MPDLAPEAEPIGDSLRSVTKSVVRTIKDNSTHPDRAAFVSGVSGVILQPGRSWCMLRSQSPRWSQAENQMKRSGSAGSTLRVSITASRSLTEKLAQVPVLTTGFGSRGAVRLESVSEEMMSHLPHVPALPPALECMHRGRLGGH